MNNSIPNENRHADTKSTPDNSKKLAEYFALDERVDAELEFQQRVAMGLIKRNSHKQYQLWSDNVLKNVKNEPAKFKGAKDAVHVILKAYLESPFSCSVSFATFVQMFQYVPTSREERLYWKLR